MFRIIALALSLCGMLGIAGEALARGPLLDPGIQKIQTKIRPRVPGRTQGAKNTPRIPKTTKVFFARQEHLDPAKRWRDQGKAVVVVAGSADDAIPKSILKRVFRLGQAIAKRGMVTMDGACPGAPHEAILGAKSVGGITGGISPHASKAAHERSGSPTKGFDFLQLTRLPAVLRRHKTKEPNYMGRELNLIDLADGVIFVRGRSGTAGEFAIALESGKPIGILEDTGGVSEVFPALVRQATKAGKPPSAPVISDTNPERLLVRLEGAIRASQAAGHRGPLGDGTNAK